MTFSYSIVFCCLLLLLNLSTLYRMGLDKRRAQAGKRRIPERHFWIYGLLGGSLGVIIGMSVWRHKTRKPSFFLPIYAIFAVQVALGLSWWWAG